MRAEIGPLIAATVVAPDGFSAVPPWQVPHTSTGLALPIEVVGIQQANDPTTGQLGYALVLRAPAVPIPGSVDDVVRTNRS